MSGPFTLALQDFAKKAGARANEAVGNIVIASAAKIDARSPVGNPSLWKDWKVGEANHDHWLVSAGFVEAGYVGGHFRANWQLGIGTLPSGVVAGVDETGERTQGKIVAEVPEQAAGAVYFIANNVPYAQRLEHGYSKQAPQGMVGLVMVEMQSIVSEACAKAKAAHP
ncbi:MAG: hypothetical protein J7496_08565 [Novosphingobium sp.]|nr:hypothetical protein [Novosphingobium sp.]